MGKSMMTILHYVCKANRDDIVELLLNHPKIDLTINYVEQRGVSAYNYDFTTTAELTAPFI